MKCRSVFVISILTYLLQLNLSLAEPITVLASQDTFITEHDGYGGSASAHGDQSLRLVGGWTGLHRTYPVVEFDLTSYAGRTIIGPTVDFTIDIKTGWGGNHVTQSVSIRESLAGWSESTASWANFGGTGFNASIHTGPNLATGDVTYHGITEPVTFSIPSATVQGWIDSSASNNGLFLISNTTATSRDMSFWSKETGTAPRLSFEVDAIPEPSSTVLIGFASSMAIFIGRRFVQG